MRKVKFVKYFEKITAISAFKNKNF